MCFQQTTSLELGGNSCLVPAGEDLGGTPQHPP